MKKFLLISVMVLLPAFLFAQSKVSKAWEGNPLVTDTTKNIATEQYCVVIPETFGNRIRLSVDFGEKINQRGYGPYYILDNDHKQMKFNSIVHALNYMAEQGWLFVNTVPNIDANAAYLLRKVLVPKNN